MARRNSDGDLESLVRAVIKNSINEYVDIIWGIANDIYDSCIKQYYATYTPKVYKRHGNIEGFNLYRANGFELKDGEGGPILEDFDDGNPGALLKYKTKEDIRSEVLNNVLSGQRGRSNQKNGKKRRSPRPTAEDPDPGVWPRPWTASYPNEYSKYNNWRSDEHTIKAIIADFEANILDDTSDLLDEIIDKQFK